MYHSLNPNLTLGYHGCDRAVGEALLQGDPFIASNNPWDWLGQGIYFWESNPQRALSFAHEQRRRQRVDEPFVVGAVLTLGNCIDTMNEASLKAIQASHDQLQAAMAKDARPMPLNRGGEDLHLRTLDCAVVNNLHALNQRLNEIPADGVRGLYHEGDELYAGSGFYRKSHIQLCIRNADCIKGVFRVPKAVLTDPKK